MSGPEGSSKGVDQPELRAELGSESRGGTCGDALEERVGSRSRWAWMSITHLTFRVPPTREDGTGPGRKGSGQEDTEEARRASGLQRPSDLP